MPVNGGVYNAMLNTTRKQTAALAACLSFLSYLATCVSVNRLLQLGVPSTCYPC
jgi:hypothetical protein